MYAIKIRKSDLALLTVLNGGVEPKVESPPTYLIIDPVGPNIIITQKSFQKLDLSKNGPTLHKLKK